TTTAVNLAASPAVTRRRVLLADFDPQGNATMGSGINKHQLQASVYDLLVGATDPADVIVAPGERGFALLPANTDLVAAEVELMSLPGRERRLRQILQRVHADYDYILIDCPPSLNMLTVNALVAAQGVLIPMQCEYYALEGL